MEDLTKDLTIELIPEQYRYMAGLVGLDALLAMAGEWGGSKIYIPKMESLTRLTRDRRIREEYNGYNIRELAAKYGVTDVWAEQICRREPVPGQLTLFGGGEGQFVQALGI